MSLTFLAKKPIDLPPMISVELIQITDKTNIPFAPKAKKIIEKIKEKEKKLVSEQAPPKKVKKIKPDSVPMPDDKIQKVENRTASNIRTIFQKAGGSLGTQGSASHNFNQLGIIKIDKKDVSDERIFELAIDAGADECKTNDDFHEIQCPKNEIYNVKRELEKVISNFISTDIEWIPLNNVQISKENNENLINFFDTLEEDDDVQNIYSNAKFIG